MNSHPSFFLRSRPALWALCGAFAMGLLLGACGTTTSKCARVACGDGKVCDEATGACLKTDGGTGGGGGGTGTDGGADGGACAAGCQSPQVCDTITDTCVDCLTDFACACPASQCSATGTCVTPTAGAEVRAGGESCALGPALRVCAPTLTFQADLGAATDSESGSCSAPGGGHDLAWQLVLEGTTDITVSVRPAAGSLAEPVVYLRRDCEPANELACADGLGGTATFKVKSLPAGTWGLVVDSYDAASSGVVEVTVTLSGPTLPANEFCATAVDLPVDGGAATVDLLPADDDLQVSCNSQSDSPEVVYRLTLTETSDLIATATPGADAGVDTVLALLPSPCATSTALQCVDRGISNEAEVLRARSLAPGTYYLVVESWSRTFAGPVDVAARAVAPTAPPPNDTCAAPRAIVFPTGMDTVTFSVDTAGANDDEAGTCNAEPESLDAVYTFTLGTSRQVTVTAVPQGTLGDAVLFLRKDFCDAASGTEVACADGFPDDTFTQVLAAGTYYLFVESYGASGAGPTQVTVTLAP